MPGPTHQQVLIIGGGTAGVTVAAIMKRRAPTSDISIVEPSPNHYYQPAFTLVGAGVYSLENTRRAEQSVIAAGVRWIRDTAQSFDPEKNRVQLKNGGDLSGSKQLGCH